MTRLIFATAICGVHVLYVIWNAETMPVLHERMALHLGANYNGSPDVAL